MDTIEILSEARSRLTDPKNWCQRTMKICDAYCLGAVMAALTGRNEASPAVWALLANTLGWQRHKAINYGTGPFQQIAGVNDICSHDEMLAWVDRTIASLKADKIVAQLKETALTVQKPELEMA